MAFLRIQCVPSRISIFLVFPGVCPVFMVVGKARQTCLFTDSLASLEEDGKMSSSSLSILSSSGRVRLGVGRTVTTLLRSLCPGRLASPHLYWPGFYLLRPLSNQCNAQLNPVFPLPTTTVPPLGILCRKIRQAVTGVSIPQPLATTLSQGLEEKSGAGGQ